MIKKEFDQQLKLNAAANGVTIDGDYIIFDRSSNLDYKILPAFCLRDLLTANPVSKTRLNKNIIVALNNIHDVFKLPIKIRASYRSPEYAIISPKDSDLYKSGDALSLGVEPENLAALCAAVKETFKAGETGLYNWGVHIGWSKEAKEWDMRGEQTLTQKFKDFISDDKMKNVLIIGAVLFGGWFFFLRK